MDSMKELKDWLVTKCRLPGFQHTLRLPHIQDGKFGSNVMTPMSIPEFVIPGSQDSSRNASVCSSDDLRSHSSGMSVTCSPCTSPAVSPRNSLAGLAVPDTKSPVRVRSAPASPRRDSHGFLRDFGARSLSNSMGQPGPGRESGSGDTGGSSVMRSGAGTGSDLAPFFINRRSGSHSLSGSFKDIPHDRRRDSQQSVTSNNFLTTDQGGDAKYRRGFMKRPFRSHECLANPNDASGASSAVREHSCLSAISSSRRCSPVFTDQNDYLPLRESFRRSQRYYRRRSSLAQVEMTTMLWRQQAEAGGRWPGEGGPSRRLPGSLLSAPHHHNLNIKRHSAPSTGTVSDLSSSSGSSLTPHSGNVHGHEACSSGVEASPSPRDALLGDVRLGGEGGVVVVVGGGGGEGSGGEPVPVVTTTQQNGGDVSKTDTERGDIKFSFQYFPATRRLKLLLIRAENLHFPERPDIITNPFFKVYLMPGKLQKQTSETVKHSRNPVYNREFFFNDINMEELRNLRLRIKAFHKSQNLKLAEYLGEVNIPLVNYDLLMENRMWYDLHFKPYEQDLGHLQVELLLEPREERLTVGVLQAKGLPCHITGAPDPYVCVAIEQFDKLIEERLTHTRKKTSNPVFKENFEVRLSCCHKDLRDTRVCLRVYDHERLRSDPVLGEVWLGRGAREESVVSHWQEMMHAPGRKLRRWHYILSAGEAEVS